MRSQAGSGISWRVIRPPRSAPDRSPTTGTRQSGSKRPAAASPTSRDLGNRPRKGGACWQSTASTRNSRIHHWPASALQLVDARGGSRNAAGPPRRCSGRLGPCPGPTSPPRPPRSQAACRPFEPRSTASSPPRRTTFSSAPGTCASSGGSRRKWAPGPSDSPKRCLADIAAIAAIAERFDVLAIQETTRILDGLRLLVEALGPDWRFIVSDATEGQAGNDERLAFVYDTRRISASGLVGEIVVSPEQLGVVGGGLAKQFARTPYVVSFASSAAAFSLTTVHILWGAGRGRAHHRDRGLRPAPRRQGDRSGRLRAQHDRARRLQHRPLGRPELPRLHLARPLAAGCPARVAAHDLLRRRWDRVPSTTRSPGSRRARARLSRFRSARPEACAGPTTS